MHPDYPNVSPSDWGNFCAYPSPLVFDEIIEHGTGEIEWFRLPGARGVAVASDHLLGRAGFKKPKFRGHSIVQIYWLRAGSYDLIIYSILERQLWIIERRDRNSSTLTNERLVISFGWTPLAATHFRAAICCGRFALTNRASGLKWVPTQ
jgi:hypothetical protein